MVNLPIVERWRKFLHRQQRELPALRRERIAAPNAGAIFLADRGGAGPMASVGAAPAFDGSGSPRLRANIVTNIGVMT